MSFGPACPQTHRDFSSDRLRFLFQRDYAEQHEDCLRVNIWTPGIHDNRKRPVLFWLHAIGFHSGSGHQFTFYDGANLARRGDVVVVSINHRLNLFGFLNLAEFGESYANSANAGMLDIVAALEWVRENIANFGGDAGNVTIFGQSGGGYKVCHLLAMPSAQGLFHKAIVQSGPSLTSGSDEDSRKFAADMVQELGLTASSITGLHTVSPERLLDARIMVQRKLSIFPRPVVDGRVLPSHPFEPVAPAISAGVPLLIGTTLHEGAPDEPITESTLRDHLRKSHPAKADALFDVLGRTYPGTHPAERCAIVRQDERRNSVAVAKRKAALKAAPVYSYLFAWETPLFPERPARAVHFTELPFVFNNTDRCAHATGGTEQARQLAARMSDAWVSFARTGNPGHSGLPKWTSFTAERDATMFFNDRCEVKFDHDRELLAALGGD